MDPLKLTALDEEDLQVMSAHLQDAVLRIGDITYLRDDKRFALVLNRFDWAHARKGEPRTFERRRTGLHFERVEGVRLRAIAQKAANAVLELLSVNFVADDPPSGRILLIFAGGGEIELKVECIEARMSDLGAAWTAGSHPAHGD